MRWPSVLAAAAALFAPASLSLVKSPRDVGSDVYRLRVSYMPRRRGGDTSIMKFSRQLSELDGSYLSIVNDVVGVFSGPGAGESPLATALRWYPARVRSTATWEMRVFPRGSVDHALGVMGEVGSGFFPLLDFTDPANMIVAAIYSFSWRDWDLDRFPPANARKAECIPAGQPEPVPTIAREQKVNLATNATGKLTGWQAFPRDAGNWRIVWNDGTGLATTNYMPVDIVWEAVRPVCEE